jgi:hypothetical protein
MENGIEPRIEGPVIDESTQEHRYTVFGVLAISFSVVPEADGWAVRIDGVPAPSIIHDHPWRSLSEAREAAVKAVGEMQKLERMQREDQAGGAD